MFQSPSPDLRFQSVPMAAKGAGKAPLAKGAKGGELGEFHMFDKFSTFFDCSKVAHRFQH